MPRKAHTDIRSTVRAEEPNAVTGRNGPVVELLQPESSPLLQLSLTDRVLRSGSVRLSNGKVEHHQNLADFWGRVQRLGVKQDQQRDLVSGAYSFVSAHRWQRNAALVRSGIEIPEHRDMKRRVNATLMREIETAEADRKRWPERKAIQRIRRLSELSLKLHTAWAEALGSPTLRSMMGPVLSHPMLQSMIASIRQIEAVIEEHLSGSSQSELFGILRQEGLDCMVKATTKATRKPCWDLIQAAVLLASGELLDLQPDTLRTEYRKNKNKKRGLLTQSA
jgi:hypothetical protein